LDIPSPVVSRTCAHRLAEMLTENVYYFCN
jgi:hypothetical protein